MGINISITVMQKAKIRQFKQIGRGHKSSKWQAELIAPSIGLERQAPADHHIAQGSVDTRGKARRHNESYLGDQAAWLGTSSSGIFSVAWRQGTSISRWGGCLHALAFLPEGEACFPISVLLKPIKESHKTMWLNPLKAYILLVPSLHFLSSLLILSQKVITDLPRGHRLRKGLSILQFLTIAVLLGH